MVMVDGGGEIGDERRCVGAERRLIHCVSAGMWKRRKKMGKGMIDFPIKGRNSRRSRGGYSKRKAVSKTVRRCHTFGSSNDGEDGIWSSVSREIGKRSGTQSILHGFEG